MRLAFLGTPPFAVPSLRACAAAGHEVCAVVTQPPRRGARGRPAPRPVAEAAAELGLGLVVQHPERLRDPAACAALLATGPEALVVAAYGQILPAALLDAVPRGGINVHASLLPRWRGAAPISAAIRAGDPTTGVSIMRMEAELDAGPVYATRATPIGARETAPELSAHLAELGAEVLLEVLDRLERGQQPPPVPQDGTLSTHAPRLTRADGLVDWEQLDAQAVDRHVRALLPWPGSTGSLAGVAMRLLEGEPAASDSPGARPGTVVAAGHRGVEVACRVGTYRVDVLQPPGGRGMDAAAWLRGRRLVPPLPPR